MDLSREHLLVEIILRDRLAAADRARLVLAGRRAMPRRRRRERMARLMPTVTGRPSTPVS